MLFVHNVVVKRCYFFVKIAINIAAALKYVTFDPTLSHRRKIMITCA